MIEIEIPGLAVFRIQHIVLDVNGTIAKDGRLLEGVAELLEALRAKLEIHLVTADTFGSQETLDRLLDLKATRIPPENQVKAKLDYIERLGADGVAAVGNGANDTAMLERAALGIFVIGPECSAVEAMLKAKIVAPDIRAALELFLHPKRMAATLRR